jgi:hypothetical protein
VERPGEPERVACELDPGGIGQVLAAAGDRELHGRGGQRREDRQRQRDEDDRPAAAGVTSSPSPHAEEGRAQEEVGDERDHADQDAHQRREADVVVAHVRELVGDDALELLAVEALHQAAGHGDRRVPRVTAGGEGVERLVLDDVDSGRLAEPGGDRHLLDDVPESRLVGVSHLPGATHGEHHLGAGVVADDAPDDGDDAEHAEQPEAGVVVPEPGEAEDEPDGGEQRHDQPHEEPRGAPVAGDLLVHEALASPPRAADPHRRSTLGTSRAVSGASKYCLVVKLKRPATMLDGTVWILLL